MIVHFKRKWLYDVKYLKKNYIHLENVINLSGKWIFCLSSTLPWKIWKKTLALE